MLNLESKSIANHLCYCDFTKPLALGVTFASNKLKEMITDAKVKFMNSEKVTKLCEISTKDLSYVVPVKSTVAFSEYMNFNNKRRTIII